MARSVLRLEYTWHWPEASTLLTARVLARFAVPEALAKTRVLPLGRATPLAHKVRLPAPAPRFRSRMLTITPVASAGTPVEPFFRSMVRAVLAGSGAFVPPLGVVNARES